MDPGLEMGFRRVRERQIDLGTCAKPMAAAVKDIVLTLVHPRSIKALDPVRFFAAVGYCNVSRRSTDRAIKRSLHVLSRMANLRGNIRKGNHR